MAHVAHTFKQSGLTGLAAQTVRFISAGVVALGFMVGAPTQSIATPITYFVNRVVNAGTVTGSITTDGTTGSGLTAAIIDSFNLQLFNGTSTTTISDASGFTVLSVSTPLVATLTTLSFDFSGDGERIRFGNSTDNWRLETFGAGSERVEVGDVSTVINDFTPEVLTEIAAVPEPSTALLVGGGLAGLLAWRMRKAKA